MTITDTEFIASIILTACILIFTLAFYSPVFSLLYNENEARIDGIKVNSLSFVMDLLLSLTIAIGSKVVGSLVVSSLLALPTAIALQLRKGYKWTMIWSAFFSDGYWTCCVLLYGFETGGYNCDSGHFGFAFALRL